MPEAAPDLRVSQLAQPAFFTQPHIFPPFIFAHLPAGEGLVHHVAVDLEKNILYCDCPFRPRPCVHARALQYLFLQSGAAAFVATDALPDWVQELSTGLGGHLRARPADTTAARRQRRNERLERAANGFDDLELWLLDTIRRGLATTVSEDPKWQEHIAGRMADASLTGLSRTLRLLGNIPGNQPDWAEKTLAALAEVYLGLRAFRRREELPEPLLADLQNWIGIATKKEEVLTQGDRSTDAWIVMGQIEEAVEDKLKVRRTWLLGSRTQRYALLLDYAFGGAPFLPGFPVGSVQQGSLAWYPSAWPLRALTTDDFQPVQEGGESIKYLDFQTFATAYSEALGRQPWLALFPANLSDVTVFFKNEKLYALDAGGKILPLQATENIIWRLLALAGGRPVSLFGEWNGDELLPLTVAMSGRVVALDAGK